MMKIMLSNYGHRYASERLKNPTVLSDMDGEWDRLLDTLRSGKSIASEVIDQLMNLGLIQSTELGIASQEIARRYCQNPLAHVTRISFELTTACNFHYRHCRNGLPAKTVMPIHIEPLKAIVDVVYPIGIRHFDFIGGEISKFGDGWLELAQYIHARRETSVALYTNGWWIDQTDFTAAGKSYVNEASYLADLQWHGVTHLVLSIDDAAEQHDHWRRHRGLYRRIIEAIPRIRAAGLTYRVSMVIKQDNPHFVFTALEIAEQLYTFPVAMTADDKIHHLIADKTNTFSNFIDIGQGAALSNRQFPIDAFPESVLRCKASYRPAPKLIITAQGTRFSVPCYSHLIWVIDVELVSCPFYNSFKIGISCEGFNLYRWIDRFILGLMMKKDAKETRNTLIALLKDQRDLDVLFQQQWYRIPLKSAPTMVKNNQIKYLAFYQPACFKEDAFKIRWYGEVKSLATVKRKEIFPAERSHPRAEEDYYRIDLKQLLQRAEPIVSRRKRRIVFINTTFERFQNARELNDVFSESPLEEKFWKALKLSDIDAERQYMEQIKIEEQTKSIYLDFAVFGRNRNIDIECDGDTYHTEKDDVKKDKQRSNALESQGWAVLRYTTDAINHNLENCIQEVRKTINTHGGLQDAADPSTSRSLEDGQQQLRLFD